MARETTQATPGTARPEADPIDPAALFTLEEAAGRVRVPVEDLEARCDRGELLFETRRRGREEVRCVRGFDLAEAFPGAPGMAAPARPSAARRPQEVDPAVESAANSTSGSPSAPTNTAAAPARAAAPSEAAAAPAHGPGDGLADAVLGSSTSREALVGLCQDLEVRLDLAERERQASTASLLMAQRRVLDLELHLRHRPWVRAGGALLGVMSVSALVLGSLLPGWIEEEAAAREVAARESLSSELGRFEATLGAMAASAASERADLEARLAEEAATTAAERARLEALLAEAAEARARAEAARTRNLETIDQLESRLAESDRQAVRRSAELGVLVESSARDRARFDERLATAERAAAAAREALAEERTTAARERAAFEARLETLGAERSQDHAARSAEIAALRSELSELMEQGRAAQAASMSALGQAQAELEELRRAEPVEVWAPVELPGRNGRGRESWWTRALRAASGL